MAKLVLGVILAFVIVLCFLPTPCESESFWLSYQYQYTNSRYYCYPYYYTYCYNWWYYGYWYGWYYWNWYWYYYPYYYNYWCNTYVGYNCYWTYEVATATGWRCQTGFTGGNCDIPICFNPACTANQVCKLNANCVGQSVCNVAVFPNYCSCRTNSAGQCLLGACSDTKDCYPGSCATSGNTCDCPPGFSGNNCQSLSQRSSITVCGSQVLGYPPEGGNLQVVATATCAAAGTDPIPVWIRSSRIDRIEVTWEVHFDNSPKLPDNTIAPYIQNAPAAIGIADSSFVLSWGTSNSNTKVCNVTSSYQTILQCNPVTTQWNELGFNIANNASFLINVTSHIGGEKKGAAGVQYGGFASRLFSENASANQTMRSMKFAFDNTPPYHCLTKSNSCTVFPIFVNQSITSNPTIQPTFNEWKDDESGIQKFHVEIFYMQPDVDGKLIEIGSALNQSDVDIKLNNFLYTCDRPGVYSIILTVYDRAGNTAKARKIIIYNDEPITISNSPMYLDKADPTTIDAQSGHAFINKLDNPPDGVFHFTANWTGHFVNNYPPEWLARVKSWQDRNITGIDDTYGSKFSMRSIDLVTGLTGIISFSYAYEIDSVGGIGAIAPNIFTQLTDKETTLTLDIPKNQLKNGETIVVWVKVYDITGSSNIIVSKTFVDTDPNNINITSTEFRPHSSDQFNSSVLIHVESKISGIKNISYQIIDVTFNSSVIKADTVLPQILRPKNPLGSISRRRRQSSVPQTCDPTIDTTCYCIPLGNCYNKTQEILIDNCWISPHAGNHLKVNYIITSLSGLSVTWIQDLGTPTLGDIPCRTSTFTTSRGTSTFTTSRVPASTLGGVKTTSVVKPTTVVRTVARSVTTVNYRTTSKVNTTTQVPRTNPPSTQPNNCPTVAQACNFIKLNNNNAPSGEYRIGTLFGRTMQVFCEMGLNGGGYTFIQPFDLPSLSNTELQAMFQDRTSFLVRARKTDGSQPFGILKQLPAYSNSALNFGLNTNAPYADPVNYAAMGQPFMSFGFHPPNIPAVNNIQGVQCNGVNITFNNCSSVSNSYVALFADFKESPEVANSATNVDFVNQIFTNLTWNPSGRVMPAEYFTFAEFQFGQGTCAHYTTTGRLRSTIGVLSVAIGIR